MSSIAVASSSQPASAARFEAGPPSSMPLAPAASAFARTVTRVGADLVKRCTPDANADDGPSSRSSAGPAPPKFAGLYVPAPGTDVSSFGRCSEPERKIEWLGLTCGYCFFWLSAAWYAPGPGASVVELPKRREVEQQLETQRLSLCYQLIVTPDELLRLLRLPSELRRDLLILRNRTLRRDVKLGVGHLEQVRLRLAMGERVCAVSGRVHAVPLRLLCTHNVDHAHAHVCLYAASLAYGHSFRWAQ